MSLWQKYFALEHRQFFKSPAPMAKLHILRQDILAKDILGKWIYVYHTDPLSFITAFLTVLDQGGFPIALSHHHEGTLDEWGFIEGRWILESHGPPAQPGPMKYAVPTSGTTGKPKLCQFDFEKAKQNALAHAEGFEMSIDIEIVQTLPVSHSYGIIAYILTPLFTGFPVNFCSGMMGLRSLKKDLTPKSSILHVSPSQARFILRDKVAATQLKKMTIGGGAVTIEELKSLQAIMPETEIFVSYGLTEAGPRVTAGKFHLSMLENMDLQESDQWIGSPLRDVKIQLIESSNGISGQLQVKTPYAMIGSDSWLRTRDHVKIVNQQVIFISREDDLIKFGGVTIYPNFIESKVREWPTVTDAIVLTEADPIYGDVPLLMIEGHLEQDTAQTLVEKNLPYSVAFKKIFILDRFPRKSLEKVDRQSLLSLARNETI